LPGLKKLRGTCNGDEMKKILIAGFVGILPLAAYLLLWPVPVDPVVWVAPSAPGYAGPHAKNTKLAGLQTISLTSPKGTNEGPEHVALGPDGKLYVAVLSGDILRMQPDGSAVEAWANTGGRVLGFDFDAKGNLIAADAINGLLSIAPDKTITRLLTEAEGKPILYADAVVVARSGKIYLSDASMRFGAKQWGGTFEASVLDIIEHSATGRIIEYDPASQAARVVMKDLCFANGVALSTDERHLFVAETGEYRIWKVDIAASHVSAKSPGSQARLLLTNLPGYPDNLMRGQNGQIWAGFSKPRGKPVDAMADKPWLRKLTLRLPRALWPVPPAYGHVIAFDESGKILKDLQDPSGAYPETTGITETADKLYVQSLHAKTLGWMKK
jgi:sugar lactone lactonase YvrE